MSAKSWRVCGLVCGLLAGIAAISVGYWVHGIAAYRLGHAWVIVGVTVSGPKLLVGVGVIMLIGALILFWKDIPGGIILGLAAAAGLVWSYKHHDHMMANLKLWAAAAVLAFLASVCAGFSLGSRVEAVGLQARPAPAGPPPAPEPEAAPEPVGVTPAS